MAYLILSILCSAIIANYLKFLSHRKNICFLTIFLANYVVAAILSFILDKTPIVQTDRFDLVIGAVAGVLLITCFLIYRKSIDVSGLALSVSAMRASLMVPVLMSLMWFGEKLPIWNYSGIVLVLVAFWVLGQKRQVHGLGWIVALFVSAGVMDSFFKFYKVFGAHSASHFLVIGFSCAFLATLFIILVMKKPIPLRSFLWGLLLGVPNQLTAYFFMKSLDAIPATFAYPMRAASVVLLCVGSDILFWKLRINVRQAIGYGIILLGIVLLNLS